MMDVEMAECQNILQREMPCYVKQKCHLKNGIAMK